jgi:hypothetical protein
MPLSMGALGDLTGVCHFTANSGGLEEFSE